MSPARRKIFIILRGFVSRNARQGKSKCGLFSSNMQGSDYTREPSSQTRRLADCTSHEAHEGRGGTPLRCVAKATISLSRPAYQGIYRIVVQLTGAFTG